jgi:hypothetical protein
MNKFKKIQNLKNILLNLIMLFFNMILKNLLQVEKIKSQLLKCLGHMHLEN